MRIGYACLTIGVPNALQKGCTLKNATESRLTDLIFYNLNSLENIIAYNIKNDIKLFRISSDLIPFGSNQVNKIPWWEKFRPELQALGRKILDSGMRVSMHPGQYTVLNSPHPAVVQKSIDDLDYHNRVLDALGVGTAHKIVLHIGGIYNDKPSAVKRFIENYRHLDTAVKKRLVIENDDKLFNIDDVLEIGTTLNIPVVFDNLHNAVNRCKGSSDENYWIAQCRRTWAEQDGVQKIHYAQQQPGKRAGSHSNTIRINEFLCFYEGLACKDIDIMLEVKDKNLSAVKCNYCVLDKSDITRTGAHKGVIDLLRAEWSKYKYAVLERSPEGYSEITKLLEGTGGYSAAAFYSLIEDALKRDIQADNAINAARYAWRYCEPAVSQKEKESFLKKLADCEQGRVAVGSVKTVLQRLALKYGQPDLKDSYYFVL